MLGLFKWSGFKTHWHLRVLYISTFLLRTAFGALLLLIAMYVPTSPAVDVGLDPGITQQSREDFATLLNVAIIAVPYPLAEMVTANYFGILSDRVGRKPVIVAGTALAAVIVGLYTLSNNVWYLAFMHGIHGIGAAATVAPAIAMIADHANSCDRGRQMGWFDYSTFLGYILGAVAGGFMIDLTGARIGFVIITALLIESAAMLYALVKSERPIVRSQHFGGLAELKRVFKVREVRLMFPIWLIIAILLGLAITYLPRIMLSEDVSGSTIGIMFAAAGVALGLLQPFWGKVSDIVGRIPVMAYGVFSIFGIVVMLVFFPDAAFDITDEGVDFKLLGMIPLAIMGLGAGAFVPAALALMADTSDVECYGATMGLYSFALGFGAFIAEGMGLGIIIASRGESAPTWLLYFAAALIGLAVVLMVSFFMTTIIKKCLVKARDEGP
ncbi:MAG: MFS transporter [Candidatus Thermoplasmatota archaeon]|nr:MFS transporter [Candidatus Thermoplasmatota archaeon]